MTDPRAQPLRGTQSLVGQMGWVWDRPLLTAIEVAWRWIIGIPLLAACWMQAQRVLAELTPEASGLSSLDPQNPWVSAVQLAHALALYQPHVVSVLRWFLPLAGLAWVVVSGLGRSLVLMRMDSESSLRFRPLAMMALQAAWLLLLVATWWGWFSAMGWVAATHFTPGDEPDLVGYAMWAIFLSLGFYTAWALVSWALSVAPILMLKEKRSALSSIGESIRLGRAFTGKLVEINLVTGIVTLALIVLAMVFSAAPLPFGDELGQDSLHVVWALAVVFYLVASDFFQVVRLKGFVEFWKMYRGAGALQS